MSLTAAGQQQAETLVYNIKSELLGLASEIQKRERLYTHAVDNNKPPAVIASLSASLGEVQSKAHFIEHLCRGIDLYSI